MADDEREPAGWGGPVDELGERGWGLLRRLVEVAGQEAPPEWEELDLVSRRVGRLGSDLVTATRRGGVPVQFRPSPACGELLDRLREITYRPDVGAWFTARVAVSRGADPKVELDRDHEPDWQSPVGPDAYREDFRRFPRAPEHVPAWLVRKVGLLRRIEGPAASSPFRIAQPFDGTDATGRPVVDRPAVPPGDRMPLLDYLSGAPVVRAGAGPEVDPLSPGGPAVVPRAFHTDGTWIWPASVAYYLRQHGVPPEPELVAHARKNDFVVPAVDQPALHAVGVVLGWLGEPESDGDRFETGVDEESVFQALRNRLVQLGVPPEAYRIGETAEGVWFLVRRGAEWVVSRSEGQEPARLLRFRDVADAAAFLLGVVLFGSVPARVRARAARGGGQHGATGQVIQPLSGEPPLDLYRDRRRIVLPTGAEIDRFGMDDGNVVYAAGTPFAMRSLPPDWFGLPYHAYRLLRPVEVLSGTAIPWFGQPGGGTAYVLPVALNELVMDGCLMLLPGYPRPY
ncbi:hypothetical protein GCM10012275_32760 [Longimycelium tulufanense]|uniref:TNT domain-containing protein n=1 Tax=Longimycelium tulufanense TaxID=907463 RepID=A0A8J3CFC5_9PSEU|nr:TNT domain-containing protein [Longimycelium tulufanense]GGM59082.1 hypothetical protein GCM10012275_32760 [Longimycelium tulufanense]